MIILILGFSVLIFFDEKQLQLREIRCYFFLLFSEKIIIFFLFDYRRNGESEKIEFRKGKLKIILIKIFFQQTEYLLTPP